MSNDNSQDIITVTAERQKTIVKTSVLGIIANVLLAGFKAIMGLMSNSIAMVLDAINNATDALSSVVTIVGAKLSAKKPDKEHPYGHGRIEYISTLVVAAIILYAGLRSLVESIKKIIDPETPDYSMTALIVIGVAVVVKLILGTFVKKKGKEVKSDALVASGKDAFFDAILSASVLASAIIYIIWGISLEAYVGIIIAVVILKAGWEILTETVDKIVGEKNDPELSSKVREVINREDDVRGAYDLILYNFGPDKHYGTVHIELPDVMTVDEVDVLTRKLQLDILKETGVIMTGIGVYSYNTTNEEAAIIRNTILKTVMSHDFALQLHGFYVDLDEKTIRFDVVLSFEADREEALAILYKEVNELYPEYTFSIVPDIDMSGMIRQASNQFMAEHLQ